MKTYSSYLFHDKDPIIHEIWDIVKGKSFSDIEHKSGVTSQTLRNWFYGTTMRPQAATARAVLRSVGYDFQIISKVREQAEARPDMVKPLKNGLRVIEGGKDEAEAPRQKAKKQPKPEPRWKQAATKWKRKGKMTNEQDRQ